VSDIPFDKNVAAVRVGRDERRKVHHQPTCRSTKAAAWTCHARTLDGVMMVEGGGHEITEDELLGAVEFGHAAVKKIVTAINQLQKKPVRPSASIRCSSFRPRSKRGSRRRSRKTSPRRCASKRSSSAMLRSRSSPKKRRWKKSAPRTTHPRDPRRQEQQRLR